MEDKYKNGEKLAPVIGIRKGQAINIDSELDSESENPVQNKAITAVINEIKEWINNEMTAEELNNYWNSIIEGEV